MATAAELQNQKNKLEGEVAFYDNNARRAREDGDTAAALKWDQQKLAAQAEIRSITNQQLEALNTPPAAGTPFTAPTNTAEQSNQTATQKKADDDAPQAPAQAATVPSGGGGTTTAADSKNLSAIPSAPTSLGGTTTQGKSNLTGVNATTSDEYPITKIARQYNPLSKLSSYTYQISLYMLNADAYNSYILQGPSSLVNNNGVRIVAQSGGVNNTPRSTQTDVVGIKRAEGFNYDYYIDNLRFTTLTPAQSQGATSTATFEFTITEPSGFNFVSALSAASRQIQSLTKTRQPQEPNQASNGLNQMYLLVTRFYGYDAAGALIPNGNYTEADTADNLDNSALFERYYPIYITSMNFSIGNRVVQYNIKATIFNQQHALSPERGMTMAVTNISGGTVGEILAGAENSLKVSLNKQSLAAKESGQFSTNDTFDFVFSSDELKNSKLIVKSSDRTAQTQVSNSAQSTVASAEQVKGIDTTKLSLQANGGTVIISLINQILKQSKFAEAALPYTMTDGADPKLQSNSNPTELTWWSVTPTVILGKFDDKRNAYAMNITYNISTYKVPYIKSVYTDNTTPYYGPVKKYQYWYTGKNSEITHYEQQFNNLYYITSAISDSVDRSKQGQYSPHRVATSGAPNVANDVGDANKGSSIINNIETSIFSPSDLAKAKLTIIGDPDYLDQSLEGSYSSIKSKKTQAKLALQDFYGRNRTINSNGGQVFIEITFAEGQDYNQNTADGLKYINNNIKFWEYPEAIKKRSPNAIIYMVIKVASTFANGKFTQELDLQIAPFPDNGTKETAKSDSAGRPVSAPSTNAASLRANINAAAGVTSQPETTAPPIKTSQPFVPDTPPALQQTNADIVATITAGTQTGVSPTGVAQLPVQDDEAAVQAVRAQPALSFAGAAGTGAGREPAAAPATARNTSAQTQTVVTI
jgi:hypothetical protein